MLGLSYPESIAKMAADLKNAREALEMDLSLGVDPEPAFKTLRALMEAAWSSGLLAQSTVRAEYENAMRTLLHQVPAELYTRAVQSETERNVERGGFGLGGILVGVGLGWLLFGRKKGKK